MSPSLETNLKVIEPNLDSMHQEAKHVLGKLIESSRKESELRQENEGLRQQTVGLQDRLEEAEKEKESIQEQLISLGDMKAENSNLTCRLQEAHVVIEDLKQQLQDERSKIDNIESMLTTRRKRPYSSGQDQNSDCHTEDHALAKRYRQDSGSGGKIHDKFDNPPSAPARQNLSDQARSDTPAHKNMNPPPRHGHDSSPANEPHKLRDGLSSHTIESNSAHQNSWPVAGNSGANRYQHGNWDSKYSFIPNILIPRPEASSEPELSIRGRAMAARGIQDGAFERGKIICHNCWEHRQNCYTELNQSACTSCLRQKLPCTRALCLDYHQGRLCFRGSKCHNVHGEKGFNVVMTQLPSYPKNAVRGNFRR